jgi:hypothetical protein
VTGVAILMAWISEWAGLVAPGIHQPGGLEHQQPQLLDPHPRLGDPVADHALLRERRAERDPRLGARAHRIDGPARRRRSSACSGGSAPGREAPTQKVGTASGLLRTFGYVGSIASATITGIVFRGGVDDAGLRHVSLILTGIGVVVLLMTVLDRHLARADREPDHSGRTPATADAPPPGRP